MNAAERDFFVAEADRHNAEAVARGDARLSTCHFCSAPGVHVNACHWTGTEYIRVNACARCRLGARGVPARLVPSAPRAPRRPRQVQPAFGDWATVAHINGLDAYGRRRP